MSPSEIIFLPFEFYYWLLAHTLTFWPIVIGLGLIAIFFFSSKSNKLKDSLSRLPSLARLTAKIFAVVGVFGSMPINYVFGSVGGAAGSALGQFIDAVLRLPWPIFRVLVGFTAAIFSVLALIAWALLLWGTAGLVIGLGLSMVHKQFRKPLS